MDRAEALEMLRRAPDTVEPGRRFAVEPFRPEDAEGVAKLFHTIYGEQYPIDAYYIPDRIREEQATGRVQSIVARLNTGETVGHMALYKSSAPFSELLECGLGMVHPMYRGTLILFHLFEELMNGPAAAPNVAAVFGEAVCDKIDTQHLAALYGMAESAMEVDVLPGTGEGRVSCLFQSKINRPRRMRVHLPPVYRDVVNGLLNDLRLEREVAAASDTPPSGVRTQANVERFPAAQAMRGQIFRPGEDFADFVRLSEDESRAGGCRVFQWFLDLSRPEVGFAADILRRRGYFLGGLAPRWFDSDALLMQKLTDPPGWDRVRLYSDKACDLMSAIRSDRDSLALL